MRLIDADALYDKAETWYKCAPIPYRKIYRRIVDSIADAPTITPPPNDPLTMEELREMDDADVWASYPSGLSEERLIMHALVEVVKENGVVWLTNNLGGRSTFDEVRDDGGLVYRRKPEEGTA